MKRFCLVFTLLLCLTLDSGAAQAYYSAISINAAQVPSTQTDFPVLVSQTDARFKTTGNGGHVANANGYDIRPYTDTTLGTAITGYELERYNATTGEVVMWVKVSSLSSSTTPIVLGYGDTSLTTDGSSSTTWSNSFTGVYHLKDGTTLSVIDSSGNHNATNNNATATTGKIDGGAAFASASSQWINTNQGNGTAFTVSTWINATTLPAAYNAGVFQNPDNGGYNGFLVKSNGKLLCAARGSTELSYDGTGSHTLSTGIWYYVAVTYNNTAGLIGYVDGGSDNSVAANGTFTVSANFYIGRDQVNGRYWNGAMDEVHIATVARSADWITTEYNNQSAPATFETLGSESAVASASTGNFFLLFDN